MKPLLVSLLLLLGCIGAPAAIGLLSSNEIASAQSYAISNLTVFKSVITPANYAFLGFHSTNELAQIALTNPVVVRSVALDRLRNYHPGDNFSTLLDPSLRLIYPIMVSTNVRSSFAFRLDTAKGLFSDARFGQRKLIRELMSTYNSIPAGDVKSGETPFAVEIPVFDIWLAGYVNTQDQLVLLATVDLSLGPILINRGQPLNEAAMFQLATTAQRYNGLPN